MECLVHSISILRRRCSDSSRLSYRRLLSDRTDPLETQPVKVVVGKERKEFLVDPFLLEANPFQTLMMSRQKKSDSHEAVYVDVDAILFEHLLWLMHNDSSSLFQLNLKEIIDFYAQD